MGKDYTKFLKSQGITSKYKAFHANVNFDPTISNNIFDELLKERIIVVSGELDSYLCEFVKANLLYMESISDDDITLYINSPGGSVYDGLGLLDVMDYIRPDISTVNTGLAASMGAIILTSGTKGKRKALKRSRVMIHQPLAYGGWMQQASDMEIEAREINHIKKELYTIISKTTGRDYEKVYKDGDRDYWMNAKDSMNYGMVDEILKTRKR